jgi:hypothetical protein
MELPGKPFELALEGSCVVDALGMHEFQFPAPIQVKAGKYIYQITLHVRIAMKKVIYDESLDYFSLWEREPRMDHPFLSMRLTNGKITRCFLDGGTNRNIMCRPGGPHFADATLSFQQQADAER